MVYRKFKAEGLFDGRQLAPGDTVLVTREDGTVEALLPSGEAGDGVEELKGLLSPGFINCHCHLELSHLKGVIPEKTGLVDFLLSVIRQRSFPPQTILSAMAAAEEEMLRNGIVAVGDICNTADSLQQKTEGNLYYHNFIETMGFIEESAPARFEHSLQVFNAFAEAYSLPIEANSIVPHAPYSVSSALFDKIAGFPGNHLLTIHNQEDPAENIFYRSGEGDFLRLYQGLGLDTSFFKGRGKRSLEGFLGHFFHNQSLILVHNVDTGEEDLAAARNFGMTGSEDWGIAGDRGIGQRGGHEMQGGQDGGIGVRRGPKLFFCLCPNANLYIGGQLPDLETLIRHQCPIVIGTDSLASNHQLSILEELKTLQQHFPRLPAADLLQWATFNGAQALQLDNVLGSFAPGKKPGLLLIEGMEVDRLTAGATVRRLL